MTVRSPIRWANCIDTAMHTTAAVKLHGVLNQRSQLGTLSYSVGNISPGCSQASASVPRAPAPTVAANAAVAKLQTHNPTRVALTQP